MIFINFKTYPEATGKRAIGLTQTCQKVQLATGIKIKLGVQAVDIALLSQQVNLPIWAQHIDSVEPGRETGFITALAVQQTGAQGVFLNHSEHPLEFSQLTKTISLAKKANLQTLVFVKDLTEAQKVNALKPDFLALEEPSLVSSGRAMVEFAEGKSKVREFLKADFSSTLLIGAGISSKRDVEESVKLGAKGVVVSSAVVLSKNPQKILEELARGF